MTLGTCLLQCSLVTEGSYCLQVLITSSPWERDLLAVKCSHVLSKNHHCSSVAELLAIKGVTNYVNQKKNSSSSPSGGCLRTAFAHRGSWQPPLHRWGASPPIIWSVQNLEQKAWWQQDHSHQVKTDTQSGNRNSIPCQQLLTDSSDG